MLRLLPCHLQSPWIAGPSPTFPPWPQNWASHHCTFRHLWKTMLCYWTSYFVHCRVEGLSISPDPDSLDPHWHASINSQMSILMHRNLWNQVSVIHKTSQEQEEIQHVQWLLYMLSPKAWAQGKSNYKALWNSGIKKNIGLSEIIKNFYIWECITIKYGNKC